MNLLSALSTGAKAFLLEQWETHKRKDTCIVEVRDSDSWNNRVALYEQRIEKLSPAAASYIHWPRRNQDDGEPTYWADGEKLSLDILTELLELGLYRSIVHNDSMLLYGLTYKGQLVISLMNKELQ